jgi:hypothetical protein
MTRTATTATTSLMVPSIVRRTGAETSIEPLPCVTQITGTRILWDFYRHMARMPAQIN